MNDRFISRPPLVMLLLGTLVVACGEPPPTSPAERVNAAMNSTPSGSDPARPLPFTIDADGVLVGQDLAPDFGPPLFGKSNFDGRCSVPSDVLIRFSIEGEATHLGRITGRAEHCIQQDFETGLHTETDGLLIYTAANGDELRDHYQGASAVPGPGSVAEHEFVGGTGRFAGASGGGTSRVICDRAAGTCTLRLQGTIIYDASNASG